MEILSFTKEEVDKYAKISRRLFPGKMLFGNEPIQEMYEDALRQHTIVAILAEMQRLGGE